jgi:hypothetical protein
MVDSSNVGLRHRVKLFDDRVTDPHLTRYYHWNMMYHPDNDIKGDFEVDARGVSVLLEKDQQAQLLLQVFQLKADPDVNRRVDWDKATEMFFQSRRLPILKDEGQLAEYDQRMQQQAEQGQGQAMPQVEVAKIRTEGAMAQEQLRQQSDMAELQAKAEEAERQRQHNRAMKEMELNMAMMQFSESNQISLEKLKAQLAISAAGMNLQKELASKKDAATQTDKTPQVAKPPTEPPGRAPNGQAYQR